jgi:hypothetical protein
MARSDAGTFAPDPRFSTVEWRAHALTLQRTGLSLRAIAAETGRSPTSLTRDLAQARAEEAVAKARDRAARQEARPKPERRPGASVVVLDGAGRLTRPDGSVVASPAFRLPRPRHREGELAVWESNEHDQLLAQAIRRAGMEPRPGTRGTVAITTPGGTRTSYEPSDPKDVQRVRSIIRDGAYRSMLAELLADPDVSPEVAEMNAAGYADHVADAWQPHPGLR